MAGNAAARLEGFPRGPPDARSERRQLTAMLPGPNHLGQMNPKPDVVSEHNQNSFKPGSLAAPDGLAAQKMAIVGNGAAGS